jgi:LmbE family N-acetylglucosaminyl deacetylase
MAGAALARRRAAEAAAAAKVLGADSVVLDNRDGHLIPTLENRYKVIRAIREFAPDVIATHRTNDYHPDHRYTGVLVQDSCYLVMVPNVVPTTPTPSTEPVVIFLYDRFTRPSELRPDIVLDIDGVMEKKLDSFMCHESQVEEWMPWMYGKDHELPEEPTARSRYLRETSYPAIESQEVAERFRSALVAKYGDERGSGVRNAEAFEISEYAARLDDKRAEWLFPF